MKKKEGTSDSIEKNRRSRSVNRLSSQVDRNDEKKKREKGSMYGYHCPRYISRDFEIDRVRNTSRAIQKFHGVLAGTSMRFIQSGSST